MIRWRAAIFVIVIGRMASASPIAAGGYLKYLHSLWIPAESSRWYQGATLHGRFDARGYLAPWLTTNLGLRGLFCAGGLFAQTPGSGTQDYATTFFDWSRRFLAEGSSQLSVGMDRLSIEFTPARWRVVIGRQRVNWGMNLVWNPNDLFNSYSFFDFDYEERPGTDAVSAQYYTGVASSVQLVYKIEKTWEKRALAARYFFNLQGFDLQVLGGVWGEDWVWGGGWSGQIHGAAFRGEWTSFSPRKSAQAGGTANAASVSADYTFRNHLYIQASVLYNSAAKDESVADNLFDTRNLSAKNLFPARWVYFVETRLPLTPLWQGGMAGMIHPADGSFFLIPSISYSLTEDLDVLLLGQCSLGRRGSRLGGYGSLYHIRLKWSF